MEVGEKVRTGEAVRHKHPILATVSNLNDDFPQVGPILP